MFFLPELAFQGCRFSFYATLTRAFLSSGSNSFGDFSMTSLPAFSQLQSDAGNTVGCRFESTEAMAIPEISPVLLSLPGNESSYSTFYCSVHYFLAYSVVTTLCPNIKIIQYYRIIYCHIEDAQSLAVGGSTASRPMPRLCEIEFNPICSVATGNLYSS